MRSIISFCVFLFMVAAAHVVLQAQPHPGFSQTYVYKKLQKNSGEFISALEYGGHAEAPALFFSLAIGVDRVRRGVVLYKTDLQGNVLQELLDTFPNGGLIYNDIIESRDGRYLYWAGGGGEHVKPAKNFWRLLKTDKDLNIIWVKDYPFEAEIGEVHTVKVLDSRENLMLCGYKYTEDGNRSDFPTLYPKICLMKVDSGGNVLGEYKPGPDYYNNPFGMEVTDDGGVMVCGRTFSFGQSEGAQYVLKTNAQGEEEWQELYVRNDGYLMEIQRSLNQEAYYNAGITVTDRDKEMKYRGFVNKIDAKGRELWRRHLSVSNKEQFAALTVDRYGSCVAAGFTKYEDVNADHAWMVKLDQEGHVVWQRSIPPHGFLLESEYLWDVVSLPDGSFVASGTILMSPGMHQGRTQEGLLIRVDSNGCLYPECREPVRLKEPELQSGGSARLYPNPAREIVWLESVQPFAANTQVRLIDLTGKLIRTLPSPAGQTKMAYPLEALPAGTYWLHLESEDGAYTYKLTLLP